MTNDASSFEDAGKISSAESVLPDKVVFLNVFAIPEGKSAEELVKLAESATQEVMRYQHGFHSATIHVSLEGDRVINYAIWDTIEDFKNMLKNPAAVAHMTEIMKTFPTDGHLYKAVSVISAGDIPQ
jgi:hypothetical protein